MVVAIPATGKVQGHQEQIFTLDRLENGRRTRSLQDRIAQRAAEPAQYRGAQQEVTELGWLTIEHFGHQVVDDVTVVAGERPDQWGGIARPGKRERGGVASRVAAL